MTYKSDIRVLITGGDGFVAPFAARAIKHTLGNAQILFTARRVVEPPTGCEFAKLDVVDMQTVSRILTGFRPTHILHLAGIASRREAEANPVSAWNVNVSATLSLAQNLRAICPGANFIFASSNQVYSGDCKGLISETASIAPEGVYASTKAAADLALGAIASNELRVIRFRPFNHTGPGQSAAYAFGSFANQIATIEAGPQSPIIRVGNLDVKRDFLDVRDVADAYVRGIALSSNLPQDNIFNLASGKLHSIRELLNVMLSHSTVKIEKSCRFRAATQQ